MTKAQTKKLDTLIAKLELLQNEVQEPRVADKLGQAKTKLLEALKDYGNF